MCFGLGLLTLFLWLLNISLTPGKTSPDNCFRLLTNSIPLLEIIGILGSALAALRLIDGREQGILGTQLPEVLDIITLLTRPTSTV